MFHDGWRRFRLGKSTRDVLTFEYNLEQGLSELTTSVKSRTYRHSNYRTVEIADKKRRVLHVAVIRDRIIHRYLYDKLVRLYDKTFDVAVFSGRQGRGLEKALHQAQTTLRRHPNVFVFRADIRKAFNSVDHQLLLALLARKLDPETYWLCQEVIRSFQSTPGRGIPIGNLTSQIFSLIYLGELDRFVRRELKPLAYLRYGDDFILFLPSRAAALAAQTQLARFLARELKMSLNPQNTIIVKSCHGLRFLGHIITPGHLRVDPTTTAKIQKNASPHNIASFRKLHLSPEVKDALDRQILAQIDPESALFLDF
ncbi:reverse transcriptase domain-containing protein [Candidatus Saccharibacteria bacterium]|nr:reverse transcriptase domain-containing protein [Candidatus Saccharibacteria bacterium]